MKKINLPFKKPGKVSSFAGINIGSNAIKVLAVSRNSKGLKLDNFVIEEISAGKDETGKVNDIVSESLKRAINKAGLTSTDVISGVSGPSVVIRYIDLPQMSKGDLVSAVRFEAKPHIPFELKDVILDFQVLDEGKTQENRKMKVLLIAAQRNFIQKHIELLENRGLKPIIIDADSFALVNAFLTQEEAKTQEAIALVNLGANLTNISILDKGTPLFTRDIPLGGNRLTEAISKKINVDFNQAERLKKGIEGENSPPFGHIVPVLENLANEIRRSFDYYESQRTTREKLTFKVFLSGGTAKLKGIDSFLGRMLDLPAVLWNPFKNFEVNKERIPEGKLEAEFPELCVACGLVLRAEELI